MDNRYIYPFARDTAHRDGNIEVWRESRKQNIACARAIEKEITANFDGMHLNKDTAKNVIAAFGYDRVNFILAATVQQLTWDGRFSHDNKAWANQFFMAYIKDEIRDYCIGSHPAILDGFINQARRAYQELNLYTQEHCVQSREPLDYNGMVLILDPKVLKDEFKKPEHMLVYCTGGFGAAPDASGRRVYGVFLSDGERCQYYRQDFLGVMRDELVPEWAQTRLQEQQHQFKHHEQEQSGDEQSPGFSMSMEPR